MLGHRYQYNQELLRQYIAYARLRRDRSAFQQVVEQTRGAHEKYKIVPALVQWQRIAMPLGAVYDLNINAGDQITIQFMDPDDNTNCTIQGTIKTALTNTRAAVNLIVNVTSYQGSELLWGNMQVTDPVTFSVIGAGAGSGPASVPPTQAEQGTVRVLECSLRERLPTEGIDNRAYADLTHPQTLARNVFQMFTDMAIPKYERQMSNMERTKKRLSNLGAPADALTPEILSAELCDHVHGTEYWKGLAQDIIMKNMLITTDADFRLPLGETSKNANIKRQLFETAKSIHAQFLEGRKIKLPEDAPKTQKALDATDIAYVIDRAREYATQWAGWFTSTFSARGHILSAGVRLASNGTFTRALQLDVIQSEGGDLTLPIERKIGPTPASDATRNTPDAADVYAAESADEFERLKLAYQNLDEWSSQELSAVFEAVVKLGMYGEPEATTMNALADKTVGDAGLNNALLGFDQSGVGVPPAGASTPIRGGGGGGAAARSAAALSNMLRPPAPTAPGLNWDTWFASEVRVAFDPLLPLLRHVGGFDILYDNAMVIPRMVQVRGHSARMQAGQAFSATLMMVNHPQLLCGTSLYERCKSAVRSIWRRRSGYNHDRAAAMPNRRKFFRRASDTLPGVRMQAFDELYGMVADAILAQFHSLYPPGAMSDAPTRHRLTRAALGYDHAVTVLVESESRHYSTIDLLLSPSNTEDFKMFCRLYSRTEPLRYGVIRLRPVFPSRDEQLHHLETVQMRYNVPTVDLEERGRWFIGGEIDEFMEGLSMARSVRRVRPRFPGDQ